MNRIYAESSAVLRWLLGTPDADRIQQALSTAIEVITSELTYAEVGRTLRRLAATGDITPDIRDRAFLRFTRAAAHWNMFSMAAAAIMRTVAEAIIENTGVSATITVATITDAVPTEWMRARSNPGLTADPRGSTPGVPGPTPDPRESILELAPQTAALI